MQNKKAARQKQSKYKKHMLVRYGRMNQMGWFEHNLNNIPKVPKRVVVKTEKGLELGQIVGQLCCYKAGQYKMNPDQVKKYFDNIDIQFSAESSGIFLRYAADADISEENHLAKIAQDEVKYCKELIKKMELPMKIIDAEHIFGGERIIYYFMSDGRVDFRELVKELAQQYQTRIEMRQVGSRDEAKMLADLEICGQQCCCKGFLKALKPVNMRMAKMQKATLDPAKISGYCGRLKCCLRYEDKTYTALKKNLPKKGTRVQTQAGAGRVIDGQILTQLVMVEFADGKRSAVPIDEISVIGEKKKNIEKNNKKEEKTRD